MKCPGRATLQGQKSDERSLGLEVVMGIDRLEKLGSLWGDGNVLKLDCGAGCTTCKCTKVIASDS